MMSSTPDFFELLHQGFDTIRRIPDILYQYNARDLVFERHKSKLYHYHPRIKHRPTVPVLVVFATVNRPEILDLFPDTSFIGGLLDAGLDVYLLDWGYPEPDDRDISISDYVTDYLDHGVKFILRQSKNEKINLIGICQGGVLCLCYAILFQHIQKLVLISTPIDFQTEENVIGSLLRKLDVDALFAAHRNISGAWLTQFFVLQRPFELIGKKYLRFLDNLPSAEMTERFVRVEKWLQDAPDQTCLAFCEFIRDFYQNNNLIKDKIDIYGRKIKLEHLLIPTLNIMASQDEIIPPSASRALKAYIGTKDYAERTYPSGHIGIYVSDKVGKTMPRDIAAWLTNDNVSLPQE